MEKWNKLATSLASIDASGFVEGLGFNRQIQAVKEKLGQVSAEDMTELPPGHTYLPSIDRVLINPCPCRVQRA